MSTRASISIGGIFLYRHCDGYPECCGRDIARYLQEHSGDRCIDPEDMATHFVRKGDDYRCAVGDNGWAEYKYVVDCAEKELHIFRKKNNLWVECPELLEDTQ